MALVGLRVIEFAGLAPGPFAGLVLADNGACVTRVDRPSGAPSSDVLCRGKRSVAISPKVPAGCEVLKRLIADADVLIDPFRPGVMERLGLGPDVFLGEEGINRRLVYARMVGFPRTGPHKNMAGHDINYLALSGVLSILPGTSEKPAFPINLLADFAGGGLMCALGILLALLQRGANGRGQIVNADMVSGTRYLASFPLLHAFLRTPLFPSPVRGTNTLDGGAPYYAVYTCADGRWISVGCLEQPFFATFIERFVGVVGKDEGGWAPGPEAQADKEGWGRLRAYLETGFRKRGRDEWAALFHGTDACVLPVLSPSEAAGPNPVPAAHPRLSLPPPLPASQNPPEVLQPGQHTREVLTELGLSKEQQLRLAAEGALGEEEMKGLRPKL